MTKFRQRFILFIVFALFLTFHGASPSTATTLGDYYLPIGPFRIDMNLLNGWKSARNRVKGELFGCEVLEHRTFHAIIRTATVDIYLLDNEGHKPLSDFFAERDYFDKKFKIKPEESPITVNGLSGIKAVYDYSKFKSAQIKKYEAAFAIGTDVLFFRAKETSRFDQSKRHIFEELIGSIQELEPVEK